MISPATTHSRQLHSDDAEQVGNPWSAHLNDEDTPDTTNRQRGDTYPIFRDIAVNWQDRDMIIPPSPTSQSAQPVHAQDPMRETDTTPADQRIASLKAIFPDFDDAVILSVLESTNNDHDRALDVLLGMNDPSFVPPNPPPAQSPNQSAPTPDAQRLSQEALDEQLARRLALEEQQAATRAWQPQAMEGHIIHPAYQSRRGGRNGGWSSQPQGQPQTQGQGGRDTMAEFQEGFNRIAESGKKTFSSIVSKVRAKMQEFDQGQGRSWSQNPSNRPPQGASSSYYAPGPQQGSEQGAYAQSYPYAEPANPQWQPSQSQPARTSTYTSSLPRSGLLHPPTAELAQPASPQQPSYYDPNSRGYDLYDDESHEIQINDSTTPSAATVVAASTTTQATVTPPRADSLVPPSDPSSPPSYTSPVSTPPNTGLSSTSPQARSLSPVTTAGVRGTAPGVPGTVDFSKLGLLPKRPISLVRPQSPPGSGATGSGAGVGAPRVAITHSQSTADSATESEFVENPFEDPRR